MAGKKEADAHLGDDEKGTDLLASENDDDDINDEVPDDGVLG